MLRDGGVSGRGKIPEAMAGDHRYSLPQTGDFVRK